jgi:O-antigen/teichoic acid export membrane protein
MTSISLGRATCILLFARAMSYFLALVNSILLARLLGVERLGVYAYAMGLAGLFALLPNLGINPVITRTIARDPEQEGRILQVGLRAQSLLATVVACAIPAFALLLPSQPIPVGYVVLAAVQMSLGTLSWPYLAVLGGRAQFERVALVELTSALIGTTFLWAAILFEASVLAALVAQVLAAGTAVLMTRTVTRPIKPSGPEAFLPVIGLLRQAAPFGASAVVQSLYTRLDVLFLGQMASHRALGLYNVAYKAPNLLVCLGSTVAGPLFPLLAQTARTENPLAFQRAVRALAVAGPALALALSGFAAPILRLLYGAEYVAAAPILALLAWSAAANWLYAPLAVALQARGCERWWLASLLVALALNAAGNLWMIPAWGAVGAAAATLCSEVVLVGLGSTLLARRLEIAFPFRSALIGLAASAAGYAVLRLVGGDREFLGTVAALTVYFTPLLLFHVVSADDGYRVMGWIRQAVPRNWGP